MQFSSSGFSCLEIVKLLQIASLTHHQESKYSLISILPAFFLKLPPDLPNGFPVVVLKLFRRLLHQFRFLEAESHNNKVDSNCYSTNRRWNKISFSMFLVLTVRFMINQIEKNPAEIINFLVTTPD